MNGAAVPLHVLTGFLGSGKTTLLRRLLADPAFADTAVLVNEFGEIGLDHHLLRRVEGETVLLKSGCVCCTVREDLGASVRDLLSLRERGAVPPFRRIVVETTGLADPVPIVSTVLTEPVLRHHARMGAVVTTVDAVNGRLHLDRQPESVKQAAVADHLVVTKTDIAPAAATAALLAALRTLNPAATVTLAARMPGASSLFEDGGEDAASRAADMGRRLAAAAPAEEPAHGHPHGAHDGAIGSFCLVFDRPIDWTAFGIWLTMLLHAHGDDILRVKGILDVPGVATPVVINGVQRVVHPPMHLAAWPDGDRRSRIVFIARGIRRETVEASLAAVLHAAAPAEDAPSPAAA